MGPLSPALTSYRDEDPGRLLHFVGEGGRVCVEVFCASLTPYDRKRSLSLGKVRFSKVNTFCEN